MATTPTDDAPANRYRTVGVHGGLDQDNLKALKREALLFDQIVIIPHLTFVDSQMELDELCWLQDIGILRAETSLFNAYNESTAYRRYLDVMVAELGEPIDVMAIPDQELDSEARERLADVVRTKGRDGVNAVFSRMFSIKLRREGINAFPILETSSQIEDLFPSGTTSDTTPVLEVVLESMPIPDDQTAWQDIIEFRNDPESKRQLRELRVWTRKFAKETTATSPAEMKEEIEVLLDEYEEQMKLHRMKVNKGATETLLAVAGRVAEDFGKFRWRGPATVPFILRERHISLLEAEAKAPNRELAFISMARERFSR